MPSPSTPQPFRSNNPPRNSLESEVWDDMSNGVYAVKGTSLLFGMGMQGRVVVMAQASLGGAGSLVINMDGVAFSPVPSTGGAGSIVAIAYFDLSAGAHTVTLTSGAAISSPVIILRRGRVGL